MKKKNIAPLLIFMLTLGVAVISCSKSNSPVMEDPMDDGVPIDDGGPLGFLGEIDWVKTFGGTNIDYATAIVKSNDNAYVIAGTTFSNDGDIIDKTGTDSDIWILKLSETGEIIWNKTYGGSNNETATDISKTSDGGYIVSGGSRSSDGDVSGNAGFIDFWVLKLNANGDKLWDKTFGFAFEDQANHIFQTEDGGYFVNGHFDFTGDDGTANDGRGNRNNHAGTEYWAHKLDPTGEYTWRRYFGGFNDDKSFDALETNDGGYLLLGYSESPDGDITDNKGSYDFWVVKINAVGDKIWTKSFGGTEIDLGYAATATNDGNYIFVGDARSDDIDVTNQKGNGDLWAVKFNDASDLLWQKTFGGSEFDSARSITPMSNGNYLMAGFTRSANGDVAFNNGLNDAWIVIMDANGSLIFEKTIGGSNFDFGEDAILAHDNTSILMVGNTESNNGDIPLNQGIQDFLIVKLK